MFRRPPPARQVPSSTSSPASQGAPGQGASQGWWSAGEAQPLIQEPGAVEDWESARYAQHLEEQYDVEIGGDPRFVTSSNLHRFDQELQPFWEVDPRNVQNLQEVQLREREDSTVGLFEFRPGRMTLYAEPHASPGEDSAGPGEIHVGATSHEVGHVLHSNPELATWHARVMGSLPADPAYYPSGYAHRTADERFSEIVRVSRGHAWEGDQPGFALPPRVRETLGEVVPLAQAPAGGLPLQDL
jgi:hypothetical protein